MTRKSSTLTLKGHYVLCYANRVA